MNIKKLCRRGNNANHEEYHSGICLSRIQYIPLYSLSGSIHGNVRWCPSLALVSLFETTSNPVCECLLQIWFAPLFCLASFPSAQGPGVVHWMTRDDCQFLLHLPPQGTSGAIGRVGNLFQLQGALFSPPGRWLELFPAPSPHALICPRFFPLMYGLCWINCPFPVRGQCL